MIAAQGALCRELVMLGGLGVSQGGATTPRRIDGTARGRLSEAMCGFVGFIGEPGVLSADEMERLAARMADRLESRVPDDAGSWVSPAAGIALGHRRIAIIDLSAAGHQPMVSASGRSVIAYNGEVYNLAQFANCMH